MEGVEKELVRVEVFSYYDAVILLESQKTFR